MKTLLLLLTATAINLSAIAGGEITGQVRDLSTNETVYNANVQLMSNGKVIKATITNLEGYYTINDLASGTYEVKVTMVGFDTLINTGIKVYTDQMTTLNMTLSGTILQGVTIIEVPEKIDMGFESGGLDRISSKMLEKMPIRPEEYASTVAGAYQEDYGQPITFRGSRVGTTLYIVDGMRIIGVPSLPMTSIEEEMVFEGGIPAKYGDTVGGVIVINTKSFHFY